MATEEMHVRDLTGVLGPVRARETAPRFLEGGSRVAAMTPRTEYKLLVACELLIPRTIGSTNRAARSIHEVRVDSFVWEPS